MTDTAGQPAAAGYSGTPLARKLGVKPGHRVLLIRAPVGWTIPDLPPDVTVTRRTTASQRTTAAPAEAETAADMAAEIIVVFCRSHRDLARDRTDLTSRLPAASSLWIVWPRRAAGHSSDITENDLRALLLPAGVVDVKVAALDHDWSGLKFVWRKTMRP